MFAFRSIEPFVLFVDVALPRFGLVVKLCERVPPVQELDGFLLAHAVDAEDHRGPLRARRQHGVRLVQRAERPVRREVSMVRFGRSEVLLQREVRSPFDHVVGNDPDLLILSSQKESLRQLLKNKRDGRQDPSTLPRTSRP